MGAQLRQPCDKNSLCCRLNNSVTVYFHPTNMQSKPSQAQIMGFPIHHPFIRLATPRIMCGCGLTKNHGLNLFIVCGPVRIRTEVLHTFKWLSTTITLNTTGIRTQTFCLHDRRATVTPKAFFSKPYKTAILYRLTSNAYPRGFTNTCRY